METHKGTKLTFSLFFFTQFSILKVGGSNHKFPFYRNLPKFRSYVGRTAHGQYVRTYIVKDEHHIGTKPKWFYVGIQGFVANWCGEYILSVFQNFRELLHVILGLFIFTPIRQGHLVHVPLKVSTTTQDFNWIIHLRGFGREFFGPSHLLNQRLFFSCQIVHGGF